MQKKHSKDELTIKIRFYIPFKKFVANYLGNLILHLHRLPRVYPSITKKVIALKP